MIIRIKDKHVYKLRNYKNLLKKKNMIICCKLNSIRIICKNGELWFLRKKLKYIEFINWLKETKTLTIMKRNH